MFGRKNKAEGTTGSADSLYGKFNKSDVIAAYNAAELRKEGVSNVSAEGLSKAVAKGIEMGLVQEEDRTEFYNALALYQTKLVAGSAE